MFAEFVMGVWSDANVAARRSQAGVMIKGGPRNGRVKTPPSVGFSPECTTRTGTACAPGRVDRARRTALGIRELPVWAAASWITFAPEQGGLRTRCDQSKPALVFVSGTKKTP